MRTDTLYITDLDGTLLDDISHVPPQAVRMLSGLIHDGAMFTVATARTPATVQGLLKGVPAAHFTTPAGEQLRVPWIVMTGSALWDNEKGEYTEIALIPEADAMAIRAAFERSGLRPFTYCLSGNSFLNVYHPRAMSAYENSFYQDRRRLQLKRFHLDQQP